LHNSQLSAGTACLSEKWYCVPSSLSLPAIAAAAQLVLIVALVARWRRDRRNLELLERERTGVDERTGALVHELNQPLTAILSNAQAAQRFLASDQLDQQELREILGDIVADAKRAAGTVRGLASRLQETKVSGAVPASRNPSAHKFGAHQEESVR
jgi:signal transduction histidine kinase